MRDQGVKLQGDRRKSRQPPPIKDGWWVLAQQRGWLMPLKNRLLQHQIFNLEPFDFYCLEQSHNLGQADIDGLGKRKRKMGEQI